jgi:hypothetical protein
MFQFTTTTIINSNQAVDAQGNHLLDNEGNDLTKFAGDADKLRVFGTGIFKSENIKSVYKRASSEGKRGVYEIVIPGAAANTLLRLEVNVKLHGRVQSDYTSYNGDFSKPAVIDIISSGTPANDAAEFARLYNKLKTEYGYSMFTAKAAGATLTLTARENGQIIHAELFEVAELGSELIPKITSLAKSTVTVSGKKGFGDTPHMLQSIAIPTYENTRHFGILKDERPIVGATYTQFTLKYDVPFGEEGVWLANNRSVTTHVFWVIDSLAAAFEAEIVKAFADVEPVTDDPKDNHTSNPGGAPGNDDDEPVTEG